MNAPHAPALPVGYSHRLRRSAVALALAATCAALVALGACTFPGQSASNSHVCADKVVQSITTNAPVTGLWSCLSADFQNKLTSYYQSGLVNSADDAVFTDPSKGRPPVLGHHFVGESNGIDTYMVILSGPSGVTTLGMLVWVTPSQRVDNLAIASPVF